MEDSDDVPAIGEINSTLELLSHPSIGVVDHFEEGYQLLTDSENSVRLVRSLGDVVQLPAATNN